jgi:hypothetical protein
MLKFSQRVWVVDKLIKGWIALIAGAPAAAPSSAPPMRRWLAQYEVDACLWRFRMPGGRTKQLLHDAEPQISNCHGEREDFFVVRAGSCRVSVHF